jgi:phage gp29-like protein
MDIRNRLAKILGLSAATPTKPKASSPTLGAKVVRKSITQVRADIADWSVAKRNAQRADSPRYYLLQDLYDNISNDALLTAQMNNRMEATISAPYILATQDGNADDKATASLVAIPVIQDLVKAILESEYYGYSVVELSADRNGAQKMELLPRRNFNPVDGRFYPDATGDKFIDYRELREYGRFVLEFYSQHIGLLNKAVPHVLFKKFAQSCWSELCEIYGIPPRYIKTNTNDEAMLSRAESMLRDMGAAAAFVIDSEEEFSFAQGTSTNGDVYNNLIRLCNQENSLLISGAIIGQDTENGNYSKEEASIKILDRLVNSDRRMVETYMNSQVIPALVRIGWLPADALKLKFCYSTADDPEKLWEMVIGLLPYKDIDNDWLVEQFGIPVRDKQLGSPTLEASMEAKLMNHITRGDPHFFQ